MKLTLVGCFVVLTGLAQTVTLPSGVYTTAMIKEEKLTGRTRFFSSFKVSMGELKGTAKSKQKNKGDTEELIIVKEGQLSVSFNGVTHNMGPGSVAFLMPGQAYALASGGQDRVAFYRLRFKSNSAVNMARGSESGGSFVVPWESVVMKENERGGRRDFFNRPTATCTNFEMHVSTLNEGLPSHAPHTHPAEEIILMIKGDAVMSIDNQEYSGTAGDLFFLASESLHGIRNVGKGQCEYFAFQWR